MDISSNSTWNKISFYLFDYWDELGDPRNQHYPLMSGGPWRVLAIVLIYLIFVTKLGKQLMKNREPYELKKAMIVYNTFMVVLNASFFHESLICLNYGIDLLDFRYPSPTDTSPLMKKKLIVGYLYILSKLLDLSDTVFIVLRKKETHLTKLHLYHHSVMPVLAWIGGRLCPTSSPLGLFPLVNSLVHTIMYGYYALAALGPHMRKYLWWKKYITLIQLIQFSIYFVYSLIFVTFQTGYPTFLFYVCGLPQPIVFFLMFKKFYDEKYNPGLKKIN